MKLLDKKEKKDYSGIAYYFGDYGEADIGISVVNLESENSAYRDILHYHQKANEYYVVTDGEVNISVEGKNVNVDTTKVLMVEAGEKHGIISISKYPCKIVAISSKKLVGDKVIVE